MSVPPEVLQKAFLELQQKAIQSQTELQATKAQIASQGREIRLAEATEKELLDVKKTHGQDTDPVVWEGVGKMFLSSGLEEHLRKLEADKKSSNDQIAALKKKENYLENTLRNASEAINELISSRS